MRTDKAPNGNIILNGWSKEEAKVSPKDATILRELAKQLRELAEHPREKQKYEMWRAHNDLENRQPLIYVDCENGWNEIFQEDVKTLRCEGDMAQVWEMYLIKEILYGTKIKDDKPLEAKIYLPYYAHDTQWGIDKEIIGHPESGEAYTWKHPVTDRMMEDDFDMSQLIKTPVITVDVEATEQYTSIAKDIFNGLLDVERRHWWMWGTELTHPYADLRGLENLLTDFYDYPEKIHEMLALFTAGYQSKLDFLEKNGLLTTNANNCYIGSSGIGITGQLNAKASPVTTMDNWGFNESQETSEVSPEMFAEFVLPYQIKLADRFGLNYYGCCEGLHKRWEYVKQIPRLRRVSVSQWSNMEMMSDHLKGDYVFAYKPSPTDLAVSEIDENYIRTRLRHVLQTTYDNGNFVELLMKDNHTIARKPNNIYRWVQIAREEIANVWG